MFNQPIPINIIGKINYFRSFSTSELLEYFNDREYEYDFDSGYYSEVFISKKENLVVKVLTTYDRAYMEWASICISKYKNNPMFPHIYLIDGSVIYMEKLQEWDGNNSNILTDYIPYFNNITGRKPLDSNHEEVGKLLQPLFDKYTYDIHSSNVLARYIEGEYIPVVTDPVCNDIDGTENNYSFYQ